MNAENFAEIIKNQSQLYQFSYQELKSLVLQYPYCQNLQFLLLVKSFLDHHKDFDKILARTATLSTDRRHLYQMLKTMETLQEAEESFELGEEFLELKDISSLEVDLVGAPLPPAEQETAITADHGGPGREAFFPEPEDQPDPAQPFESIPLEENAPLTSDKPAAGINGQAPVHLKTADPPPPAPAAESAPEGAATAEVEEPVVTDGLVRSLIAWSGLRESLLERHSREEAPAPPPAPKPKSAFSSWPGKLQPPTIRFSAGELSNLPPQPQKPAGEKKEAKKKKKEEDIIEFAERSLKEHEEVATETLADLLVQQERYDKAIQMYKRLILIFPEKSTFFAEKIEELKKLR